jgi:hypothetical protein
MEEVRRGGDVLWLWGIPTRGLGIFSTASPRRAHLRHSPDFAVVTCWCPIHGSGTPLAALAPPMGPPGATSAEQRELLLWRSSPPRAW